MTSFADAVFYPFACRVATLHTKKHFGNALNGLTDNQGVTVHVTEKE
ncbi:MAG: hypothetical protein U0X41_07020 [Chitinophagales bacterium]